jgi:hypothetical protein
LLQTRGSFQQTANHRGYTVSPQAGSWTIATDIHPQAAASSASQCLLATILAAPFLLFLLSLLSSLSSLSLFLGFGLLDP